MSTLRASAVALGLTAAGWAGIACGAVLGGPWRVATGVVVAILIACLLAATWAENKSTNDKKEKNHV